MNCHEHVARYAIDVSDKFAPEADEAHFFYQIKCSCGGIKFKVKQTNKPSVFAICPNCSNEIIVYDVSLYPTGISSKEPYSEVFVQECKTDEFNVYVMFEYSALDDDQVFDPNDISWCAVFVENSFIAITKIIDDETA